MEKMRVYLVYWDYRYYYDNKWQNGQNPIKIFASRKDAIAWIKEEAKGFEVTMQEECPGDGYFMLEFVEYDCEGDPDMVYRYQISGYPYYVE